MPVRVYGERDETVTKIKFGPPKILVRGPKFLEPGPPRTENYDPIVEKWSPHPFYYKCTVYS